MSPRAKKPGHPNRLPPAFPLEQSMLRGPNVAAPNLRGSQASTTTSWHRGYPRGQKTGNSAERSGPHPPRHHSSHSHHQPLHPRRQAAPERKNVVKELEVAFHHARVEPGPPQPPPHSVPGETHLASTLGADARVCKGSNYCGYFIM